MWAFCLVPQCVEIQNQCLKIRSVNEEKGRGKKKMSVLYWDFKKNKNIKKKKKKKEEKMGEYTEEKGRRRSSFKTKKKRSLFDH